jgi:hypothetical protein
MNMRFLALLAIILLAGAAFATPKLKKFNITKEITVSLPKDFTPLPDDGIAREYPATTRPLAVYTSPNGQIDFSVTKKKTPFKAQDLPMLREFYKANLLEKFTKVDFIRQEVTQVKGKDFIVFEFVSVLADERKASNLAPVQKYSIIQYTIQNNELLIFTLHVPFAMKNEWQDAARQVMNSVAIK